MYRTWVHFSEAKKAGIKLTLGKKPWKLYDDKLIGYGNDKNRGKVTKEMLESKTRSINEYRLYGYWTDPDFLPDMYVKILNENAGYVEFRGLIATGRQYKNKNTDSKNTFITIGYKTGYFIDITISGLYKVSIFDAIKGKGYVKEYVKGSNYLIIDVKEHKFEIF